MEFNVVDYNPREKCYFWTKNTNTPAEANIYFIPYRKALIFFPNRYEHGFIKLVENPNSLARLHELVLHTKESPDNFKCLDVEENYLESLVEILHVVQ